jgi:virginiamycin B lyase
MRRIVIAAALLSAVTSHALAQASKYFELPKGDELHDVAVGSSGEVWYAGQATGIAGRLDPATGIVERIWLGKYAAPHGVIIGPDGAPWFTDGGQNAIVRIDPISKAITVWPLPLESMPFVKLGGAAFDRKGRIWFTGHNGLYGCLDPSTGDMSSWDAPRGYGPYGITATPTGDIWYVSTTNTYLANIDIDTGRATLYEPPIKHQGARRVWSDSRGRLWIGEADSGRVSVYDPAAKSWEQWKLPGSNPHTRAIWVDPDDKVWLSEWSTNAIVRFDPATAAFERFLSDRPGSNVRHLLGRKGEVWIAESGTDRIRVIRYFN